MYSKIVKNRDYNIMNNKNIINGKHLSEEFFSRSASVYNTYILYYVISGSGRIISDGTEYKLGKGESFIIYPDTLTEMLCDALDPWELCYIDFNGLDVSWILDYTAFSKNNPVAPPIRNLAHLFGVTKDENKEIYQRFRTQARLYNLFSYYIENFPTPLETKNNYVEMACDYIAENYSESDCSSASVARYVKIDRTYLFRLFKKEAGVSVGEYINRYRINIAGNLLRSSNTSVKDIAYSVGFMDQLYFSKVFKKYTGFSPSEYRKKFGE